MDGSPGQVFPNLAPLFRNCTLFGGVICELWTVAWCNVLTSFHTLLAHTEGWKSAQECLLIHVCSWYLLIYFRDFMVSAGIFGSSSLALTQHSCCLLYVGYRYVTRCFRTNITRWSHACLGLGRKVVSFTPRRLYAPEKDSKLLIGWGVVWDPKPFSTSVQESLSSAA